MSELKQIHISDFYWYLPSKTYIRFEPKSQYAEILPKLYVRPFNKERSEILAKMAIWENKDKLFLKIKYCFLIKGNFIRDQKKFF